MFAGRSVLIYFFIALLVALFIQGCAIDDSRKNADDQQHLEDNGQDSINQEPQEEDEEMAADDNKENANDQQYVEDNSQDPINQEPQEQDGLITSDDCKDKILEILERDIEFAPAQEVYSFELKPGYYEDAAANQLLVRYTRETTMAQLKEVFVVAEKYGAALTGNKVELRLVQFKAANEDIVGLKNDLNKISTINAYLNMIAYEEEE